MTNVTIEDYTIVVKGLAVQLKLLRQHQEDLIQAIEEHQKENQDLRAEYDVKYAEWKADKLSLQSQLDTATYVTKKKK